MKLPFQKRKHSDKVPEQLFQSVTERHQRDRQSSSSMDPQPDLDYPDKDEDNNGNNLVMVGYVDRRNDFSYDDGDGDIDPVIIIADEDFAPINDKSTATRRKMLILRYVEMAKSILRKSKRKARSTVASLRRRQGKGDFITSGTSSGTTSMYNTSYRYSEDPDFASETVPSPLYRRQREGKGDNWGCTPRTRNGCTSSMYSISYRSNDKRDHPDVNVIEYGYSIEVSSICAGACNFA